MLNCVIVYRFMALYGLTVSCFSKPTAHRALASFLKPFFQCIWLLALKLIYCVYACAKDGHGCFSPHFTCISSIFGVFSVVDIKSTLQWDHNAQNAHYFISVSPDHDSDLLNLTASGKQTGKMKFQSEEIHEMSVLGRPTLTFSTFRGSSKKRKNNALRHE